MNWRERELIAEVALLRHTIETVTAGIGDLLDGGITSPAVTRRRLIELYAYCGEVRKEMATGTEVAATVTNILRKAETRQRNT